MKHLVKKAMLTGAFGCFLLGTALADNATASQDTKPYWQDVQVVAVNLQCADTHHVRPSLPGFRSHDGKRLPELFPAIAEAAGYGV